MWNPGASQQQMETSMNIFTPQRCLWSADWGNMQRDTHPFLQPRVCVPVHNYVLIKCTRWSREMNDTGGRNHSLHEVLHLLTTFFPSIYLSMTQLPIGPHTLSIRLDYHFFFFPHHLSSHLLIALLCTHWSFGLCAILSPKCNQDQQFSTLLLPTPCSLKLLLPLFLQLHGKFPLNVLKVSVGANQSTSSLNQ